jgi:hypothetical protein
LNRTLRGWAHLGYPGVAHITEQSGCRLSPPL